MIFPCINLHSKLVPGYEYGLLVTRLRIPSAQYVLNVDKAQIITLKVYMEKTTFKFF